LRPVADVAKLADAPDLGSGAARHVGSIPIIRTLYTDKYFTAMATITRENIGNLNDKLIVNLEKNDYLPSFEKSLKSYAKSANIPGFRKGMVPSGLIKKMYGQSVFTEEILRTVEKELNNYLGNEQLDIFAQPLPLESDSRMLDMNSPGDYAFAFEIGLKPDFDIKTDDIKVTFYKVLVKDEMINEEINRMRTRYGKMIEPEEINNEENVLNIHFSEADENGNTIEDGMEKDNSLLLKYFSAGTQKELSGKKKDDSIVIQLNKAFEEKELEWVLQDLGLDKNNAADAKKFFKLTITKIGFVEKADLDEKFFNDVYPESSITNEEELRNAVKVEIENYYDKQSRNQLHDQIYHYLVDNAQISFPENFLKRWLQVGGEKEKSADDVEKELPVFLNQLKWTLISTKLINENKITIEQQEIKDAAMNQITSYMRSQNINDAPWLDEYANRMLQDKKFVEETYMRLQTEKLFNLLESKVAVTEEPVSAEQLEEKMHHHHH
jgi:trigger factor